MKDFSPLAIDQPVIGFPARIGVITRQDGTVIRFAESDEPLVVDGDTFGVVDGLSVSAVKHTSNGEVPSCQFVGVLGDTFVGAAIDIGLFDAAKVQIYIVDRLNLSRKGLHFTGEISDISVEPIQRQFSFNVKGPSASSRIVMTRKRSPMCETDFGSVLCQIDIEDHKAVTTVATVDTAFSFTVSGSLAQADGYFNNGVVVTDAGDKFEIGNWTNSTQKILTYQASSRRLAIGQSITLYKGCNKTKGLGGCADVSNWINFQGEPHFLGSAAAAQQV